TLGHHPDRARGHHELAILVAVLGDRLAELELAGTPVPLPLLARLRRRTEHLTRAERAVVLVMLFRVKARAAGLARRAFTHDARSLTPGTEPRLAILRTQSVVGIELRARLHEGRWCDDRAGFGALRVLLVGVHGVRVTGR